MPGRNFTSSSYRYGMNGQEKDDEIVGSGNNYDFGARHYDPRLGRWWSSDPKEGKYPAWSPYHFGYNNPIVTVDRDGEENIVVVGTQHDDGAGNKAMFMMQAIRSAKGYYEANSKEMTTVLLMKEGYTQDQINTFKESLKQYGVNVIEVSSSREIVNYVNTKTQYALDNKALREADPVSNLDMFSHGYPGRISFGEDMGDSEDNMMFGKEQVAQLSSASFGTDPATGAAPSICSYACRTGVTQDGYNLAQDMANQTGATVTAFKRRTNYSGTFTLPGFKVPLQVKLFGTYGAGAGAWSPEFKKNYFFLNNPKFRTTIDGALFDKRGAMQPVKSGDTPSEQPSGTFEFKPQN